MAAWSAIFLLAAVAGADDAVLLEFSTANCEPCRMMEPVLRRLGDDGYPVQQIKADSQPQVARQFRVDSYPTFILIRGGREQGRIVGATSYDRLVQLFSPNSTAQGTTGRAHAASEPAPPRSLAADVRKLNQPPASAVSDRRAGPVEQAAYRATIRLKIEEGNSLGYGTGTIIDTHEDEALAVTCGHLFRNARGQGKLTADLFVDGQSRTVEAQLIDFDLDRDVALVSLRPGVAITAAQVAPAGFRSRPGERVFSIGCDKGANPTVRPSNVAAVNKFSGHPNITVKGQPVDGRSGGGLFSSEGLLIGVCNAANPADDEGLYAGLEAVHWQLDRIGQQAIYQRAATAVAVTPVSAPPPSKPTQIRDDREMPALPGRMPSASGNLTSTTISSAVQDINSVADAIADGGDYEMICIVRPKKQSANSGGQVFVVDNASTQLVQQLARTSRVLSPEQGLAGATAALTENASRMVNRLQPVTGHTPR